jgi:predicted RND superfamily exporter protein
MNDIRSRIEIWFQDFGLLVCSRPWLFIIGSALVFLAMVSHLPGIRMDTSAEGLLHKDDPALITYESFRQKFGRDQVVIIGIQAEEIFDLKLLRTLKDFHATLEKEVQHLSEVNSLVNTEFIRGEGDDLIVEDLLGTLPENEQQMQELKQLVLANPLYRNILISEDSTFTIFIIKPVLLSPAGNKVKPPQTAPEESLPPLSEKEMSRFIASIEKVCDRYRSRDLSLYLGGDLTVEEILKNLTLSTMVRFTLLTTLVVIVVFAFLFRRLSGVLLPLLVVNLALYSTLGLMAALKIPVTLNTTVLPSFLLAVGIGDSVHILAIYYKRLQQAGERKDAISFALGHSGLAVVMTSLTTASGLFSFVGSGIAPVANLGIFAAIGVMLALVFSLVTLPALLFVTPSRKHQQGQDRVRHFRLDTVLTAIGDFSTGHPKLVILVSTFLFFVSLFLALQLRFTHNSLTYLKREVPVRVATEVIDNNMKGSVNVEVLIDSGESQGLYEPSVMNRIETAGQQAEGMRIEGRPVGRASSAADMIKEINQALHGGDPSEYRIPDQRELIAQELLLYEIGGGDELDKQLDRDYRQARLTVRVPWVDAISYVRMLSGFEKRIQQTFLDSASVTVTGLAAIIVRTLTAIIRSMAQSYLLAGSVITVLMIVLIGNVRTGLCSMAPNFLPIVLGLGLMKLTGIPLDYSTIMVGGIAIGLAVDDTVHFMHNFRRYYNQTGDAREAVRLTLTTSGRAMLFTTVILGAGFFILLFADLRSTFNFGVITGFTICMALLADFFLAPAMMVLLTRKKKKGDGSIFP